MGRICRIYERVKTLTPSTSRDRVGKISRNKWFWLSLLLLWLEVLLGLEILLLRLDILLLLLRLYPELLELLLLGLECRSCRLLRLELSSICIEFKISMCWVIRVNKWVSLGLLLRLALLGLRSHRNRSSLRGRSCLHSRSLLWGCFSISISLYTFKCNVRVICSRIKTCSSSWDMITFKDPEAIFASSVLHSDCFPICINVAILTNSFTIRSNLFPGNCTILLGISRTKSAISSIKSLLSQDLCIFALELRAGAQN